MSQCRFNCPNFKNNKFKNFCRCNNKNQCCDCSKKGKCKWCVSLNNDKKTTNGRCIPIDKFNDQLCPPHLQENDCLNNNINKYIVNYPTININKKKEENKSKEEPKKDSKEESKTIINKYIYKNDNDKENNYKNYLIFGLFIIIIFLILYLSSRS